MGTDSAGKGAGVAEQLDSISPSGYLRQVDRDKCPRKTDGKALRLRVVRNEAAFADGRGHPARLPEPVGPSSRVENSSIRSHKYRS